MTGKKDVKKKKHGLSIVIVNNCGASHFWMNFVVTEKCKENADNKWA